jgi:hypothetical protein
MTDKWGYPTEQELKQIREWDCVNDLIGLLEFVRKQWQYCDAFTLTGKRVLRLELHTLGWSGNEQIIEALQENVIFWMFGWQKSTKGGHYYFKFKNFKIPQRKQQ